MDTPYCFGSLCFLEVSEDDTFASSAFFGVEGLYDAWRNYNLVCETNGYVLDNTDVLMSQTTSPEAPQQVTTTYGGRQTLDRTWGAGRKKLWKVRCS